MSGNSVTLENAPRETPSPSLMGMMKNASPYSSMPPKSIADANETPTMVQP